MRHEGKFTALICYLSYAVLLGGALSFLATIFWFFDLFSHFVLQYAILSFILAIITFGLKQRPLAYVLFLVALMFGFRLEPYLDKTPPNVVAPQGMDQVDILQFNVHNDKSNMTAITNWIISQGDQLDVVVLFEISDGWTNELLRLKQVYPIALVAPIREWRNVAIFTRLPVSSLVMEKLPTSQMPMALMQAQTPKYHFPFVLGAVHPPTGVSSEGFYMRNAILRDAASRFNEIGKFQIPAILLGDMNITRWSPFFTQMVTMSGLYDTFRAHGIAGTWPSTLPPSLGIPIDQMLVSPSIIVIKKEIGESFGSDHYPVITHLAIAPPTP